jgi:hypothetical protein
MAWLKNQRSAGAGYLAKLTPWGIAIAAGALLVIHALGWKKIQVDAVTLGLLGIILISSRWDLIRKLRFGELEAEIAPAEVRQAEKTVTEDIGPVPSEEEIPELHESILRLTRQDPPVGLAKLRIELERILRTWNSLISDGERSGRNLSLSRLVSRLYEAKAIPLEIADGLREVLHLANRAVHGEYIRREDAETVAGLGVSLLLELQKRYTELVREPVEKKVITQDDVHRYEQAKYRVTTVIPVVGNPTQNVYIVDQELLTDMLEGYEEYAEFVVGVELVESATDGRTSPS